MKRIREFLSNPRYTPLLFAVLVVLSYGLVIPLTGYFMDDWYLVWFKHNFGALSYPAYFALDRPLMGFFYVAANFLLGNTESPLVWHLFGLATRWLLVVALWDFLNTFWPENKRRNIWVALLAAVFPGFTQHWIVLIYSFFYTCLAGFFYSLTLMLKAVRGGKPFWLYYLSSFIIGLYSFGASEFYYGLELVRGVILWLEFKRSGLGNKPTLLKTLRYWSAYLAGFLLYSVWRAFFFNSVNHKVALFDVIRAAPVQFVLDSLRKVYQAALDAVLNAWTQVVNLGSYPSKGATPWIIALVMLAVFLLVWAWSRFSTTETLEESESQKRWFNEALVISLASLLLAVLPFLAANLPVSTRYPYDRFMLAYLFGSCLLVTALLNPLRVKPAIGKIVLMLLIAASAGFQFNTGLFYKNLWKDQKDFLWQLSWRIPALEKGTTLVSYDLPYLEYYSGYALAAQLNWTYADEVTNKQVDYHYILLNTSQAEEIPSFAKDKPIKSDFRTYTFNGNTSQLLMIAQVPGGCVRVLDADLTPVSSLLDEYDYKAPRVAGRSNLSVILPEGSIPNHPPMHILGLEPAHTWCYYFEKAELARQWQDYATILSLLEDVKKSKLGPFDLTEWYPFIDALARTGDLRQAANLSEPIRNQSKSANLGVCTLWTGYANDPSINAQDPQTIQDVLTTFECQK